MYALRYPIPSGAESAIKHNEYEGYGTGFLGEDVIFEMQRHQAIIAEDHSWHDESQEGGDADSGRDIVQPNAQQDDDSDEDEEESDHFLSIAKASRVETCRIVTS